MCWFWCLSVDSGRLNTVSEEPENDDDATPLRRYATFLLTCLLTKYLHAIERENRGSSGRILTHNELVLTFWVTNYGAKFHQNWSRIETVGEVTDRQTWQTRAILWSVPCYAIAVGQISAPRLGVYYYFFVVDSETVCMYLCLSVCHGQTSNCFFLVSRWNRFLAVSFCVWHSTKFFLRCLI